MTKTPQTMEVVLAGNRKVQIEFFCSKEAYPHRPSLADLYCTVYTEEADPIELKEIIHRKIVTDSEVLHQTVREIVQDYFSAEAKPLIPGEYRG